MNARPRDLADASARAGEPLSLPAAAEQWPSGTAMRRLIGAWAYGALAEADRPSSGDVRRAIGVGCALAELVLENGRRPFGGSPSARPLWEIEIEVDPGRLADLAGCAPRDAADSLELLRRSGALLSTDGSGRRARLAEVVCEAAPGAVRVHWPSARDALREAGAPTIGMAAPLAVLREIARASGPVPDPAAAAAVRYSVREMETATLFSRSTVSEALALLERAGLLGTEARRGQTLRCTLLPRAFGIQAPAPRPPVAAPPASPPASPATMSERPVPPAGDSRAPLPAPAERAPAAPAVDGVVRLGEFAGTPIFGPRGTPLVVECDERGRWSCRVGPFLRLGPTPEPE